MTQENIQEEDLNGIMTDTDLSILRLVDHDNQFVVSGRNLNGKVNVLNSYDLNSGDFVSSIIEVIASNGSNGDSVAHCDCGCTEGDQRIGSRCRECGTFVQKREITDDDNLTNANWFRCPEELASGWLHPVVYMILSNWLVYERKKKGGRNYLDDILNVDAEVDYEIANVVNGRGFQYLRDNFDRLMDFFINDHPKISEKSESKTMRFFLDMYKDVIWCRYIPIMPAALNPITSRDPDSVQASRQIDPITTHVMEAASILSEIDFGTKRRKDRQLKVERQVWAAYQALIAYNEEATRKFHSTKKAIPRTQMLGARMHLTFRAVIGPIIGEHVHDELHIPWSIGVNTLRVHIIGILQNRYDYMLVDAQRIHSRAITTYDKTVDDIMKSLIEESPCHGLPVLWHRPPSIRDGNVMLKRVTRIKTDINDPSISMTPIDVALPNAD